MTTRIALTLLLALPAAAADQPKSEIRHPKSVVVYREPGRFGAWPANQGVWSWGNEIVVGLRSAIFKVNPTGHAMDNSKPQDEYQARSLDGGLTWSIEKPPALVRPENGGPQPVDPPGGIDFTHPDFAMMSRASGSPVSRFYYSLDRCRTWRGPFNLPLFGQKQIMARTDYLVNGRHDLTIFLTAAKTNGKEGRVFCARTRDGGATWKFLSWLGPEPDGFAIMPSSVRLSPTRIMTAIRRKEGPQHWIEMYETGDDGASWRLLPDRPAPSTGGSSGNPPSMRKLKDGRLVVTYGYRAAPYGIRARLSGDGRTWGEEIVLRDDGGCWDLGYPRTVQRPDGKLVTMYYFNDDPQRERYIAATIWDGGKR